MLPLLLDAKQGTAFSWATPRANHATHKQHNHTARGIGGLRGASRAAIIEAERSTANKMGTATFEQLDIFETCHTTEECAPGLFMVRNIKFQQSCCTEVV